MNLVLKLISSPWFWADILLSISGGVIVYWGLLVEKKAEKHMPPSDFKPDIFEDIVEAQKSEIERGWRILMTGIVVEVVAAFGISVISGLEIADLKDKSAVANLEAKQAVKDSAAAMLLTAKIGTTNAQLAEANLLLKSNVEALVLQIIDASNNIVKNDPLNQPIGNMSAELRVCVSGADFFTLTNSDSLPVAKIHMTISRHIQEKTIEQFSHPVMVAKAFEPMRGNNDCCFFRFEPIDRMGLLPWTLWEKQVNSISDIKELRVFIRLIPPNSKILRGVAYLYVNDFGVEFEIPEQISGPEDQGYSSTLQAINPRPIDRFHSRSSKKK